MESSLFVFFVILSMSLFIDQHFTWAAAVAACATLTRPEGILLLIIMGGIYVFQFHKIPWRMVGISLAIGLPWLLFASLYFGSPLPHSMIAKRSTYGLPPLTALRSLLGYLSAYTLPVAGIELTRSMKYGFVIFVSLLAGMAEVARPRELRQRAFALLWLFPALYLAFYAVANPPVWEWYALPIIPPVIVLLAVGLFYMRTASISLETGDRAVNGLFGVLLAIVSIAGVAQVRQALTTDLRIGRELSYAAIAQQLANRVSVETTVATPEIGTLGFQLPDTLILDTQGLVSPVSIPHQRQMLADGLPSGSVPLSLIVEESPEFIVAPERLIRYSLLQSEWFSTHYQQIIESDSDIWDSKGILVFARSQNLE
jgi:hypothetical protein